MVFFCVEFFARIDFVFYNKILAGRIPEKIMIPPVFENSFLKGVKKTLSGTVLRGLTLFFLPSGHLQTFNNLVTQKTLHFEERK